MPPVAPSVGFVSQNHTGDVAPVEAIERGAAIGFDSVEPYLDGSSARSRPAPDAIVESLAARDLDLAVDLPFVDIDLGSPRERVREASVEELATCLRFAGEVGAEKAVVHPEARAGPPEYAPDDLRSNVLSSLRRLDALAADLVIELCAEDLPTVTSPPVRSSGCSRGPTSR